MKRKEFIYCILYIFIISGIAIAQNEPYTLDSLIELALAENPDIQNQKLLLEASQYGARSAGTLPDPTLTFGAMNLPRTSLALDETPMSSIVVGFSQNVPWLGKLKSQKAIANLMTDIGVEDIRAKENSIARDVRETYYEYSFWSFAEQIVDSNSQLIEYLIDVSETRYANGLGSAQDYLRAQTALSLMENRRAEIKQRQDIALYRLIELTNNIDLETAEILPSLSSDMTVDFDSEINNPDLKKAGIKLNLGQQKLNLARKEYYPNFMFGVDYSIRKETTMDPVKGEDFISAKVGIQIPLWFFAKQKNNVKSTKSSMRADEYKFISAENRLKRMINSAIVALNTYEENYQRYDEKITGQAEMAFTAARSAYEVGEVDFNAVLSAQMELLNIELEKYALLKNYWQKAAELTELYGVK